MYFFSYYRIWSLRMHDSKTMMKAFKQEWMKISNIIKLFCIKSNCRLKFSVNVSPSSFIRINHPIFLYFYSIYLFTGDVLQNEKKRKICVVWYREKKTRELRD